MVLDAQRARQLATVSFAESRGEQRRPVDNVQINQRGNVRLDPPSDHCTQTRIFGRVEPFLDLYDNGIVAMVA